jgi:glycogen synthase
MATDVSWRRPATHYADLYKTLAAKVQEANTHDPIHRNQAV